MLDNFTHLSFNNKTVVLHYWFLWFYLFWCVFCMYRAQMRFICVKCKKNRRVVFARKL